MRQTEDVFRMIGASNHCEEEREANDFYATDPECVKDILAREHFSETVIEPCCGTGNISKELDAAGYKVISTDLIDRGYGRGGVDFFTNYYTIEHDIVSNPPYALATEFIDHALKHAVKPIKIALFLKLQFLEGQERYEKIFSGKHLETVYVYSKRASCYKNDERYQRNKDGSFKLDSHGNKVKVGSAIAFCWMIFNTEYNDDPRIKWIADKKTTENSFDLFKGL